MRVFAGPNGSGKTTIIKTLQSEIPFGVYVNADDIQRTLEVRNVLLFEQYQLQVQQQEIETFFKESQFSPVKRNEPNLWQHLTVQDNVLHVDCSIDSYIAADIAEFIRQQLLANGLSFTYETVMSHSSKVEFMERAQRNGYRVYLYFIATEDPEINVSRVNVRIAQHGHAVPSATIKSRYYKSLQQLKKAIKYSNRAYIFDNSGSASTIVAEITNGYDVNIIDTNKVPNWFVVHVVH